MCIGREIAYAYEISRDEVSDTHINYKKKKRKKKKWNAINFNISAVSGI